MNSILELTMIGGMLFLCITGGLLFIALLVDVIRNW
jgi:hypothetical protein